MSPPDDSLRPDCEDVIRRFEDAWRAPGRPDLAAFLPAGTPPPTGLLVELVHVDLEFRFRTGDDARVEEYLARFPELDSADHLPDLIRAEFALRGRHRPPAAAADFAARFPALAGALPDILGESRRTGRLTPTVAAGVDPTPLPVAPSIPGYDILGEVGRGGMGVVYKAHDRTLRRTVAVKTLGSIPAADSRARFAHEAEAIATLDHPHIVPVYEVGEWAAPGLPPVPFFVMKFYPGGSLDAAPAGPGTDYRKHAIAVEVIARAVHHAHQRGVLHRDLKPSNILLDENGWPHVADFGLAGRFDPADPRTLTAAVVGTPAYMAPEQARAPREVTVAADVYGLGAVLYHQLTGKPPFYGATPLSTLELVANAPPARPTSHNPGVPRDLETICLKCLEKEPARRYATAAELADDLERWRTGRPVVARPVRGWEHAWRWARRHPVVAGMAAVTAAALFFSVVVLAQSNAEIQAKEKETREAYLRECALRYELTDTLTRERRTLYLERVASAGRLYAANQLPQAWRLLDQCPEEFRRWEWQYLDGLRRATPPPLAGHDAWVGHAAALADGRIVTADFSNAVRVWNPDGTAAKGWQLDPERVHSVSAHPTRNWVAVGDARRVTVWDADTGAVVTTTAAGRKAAFSPCGRWLGMTDGPTVRVLAVPDWTTAHDLRGHAADATAVAFTPDGARLHTGDADGTIRTWNLHTGDPVGDGWKRPRAVAGLAVTGDGKWLIESHAEGVVVADPTTGKHLHRIAPTAVGRSAVAVCPGADHVAVVGTDREVIVWGCAAVRPVNTFRGHTAGVSALAFTRDGKKLVSAGGDQAVRVWDVGRAAGGRVLCEQLGGVGSLAVTGDGMHAAFAAHAVGPPDRSGVKVIAAASGAAERTLAGAGEVTAAATGTRLASGRTGGGLSVWDAATGAELWADPAPDRARGGVRVALTADGARLASWSAAGGGVRVRTLGGGPEQAIAAGGRFVYGLAFSRDGTRLAVAGADGLSMWDATTGARVAWADGPREAYAVAFTPDGGRVAVSEPGAVRTREAATGKALEAFAGNPLRVNALAFNDDGSRLLTGGSDGSVRVWDAATGTELLTLPGGAEPVTGVAWRGGRIYAAGDAVRAWEPER